MTVRYYRPVSSAANFSRRVAIFALMLAIIAFAMHRFGPLETPYFLAIFAVSCIFALIAILLAVIGLYALWSNGAKGGKASAHALFLVLPQVVIASFVAYKLYSLPMIYDVTTDIENPPRWIEEVAADQSWLRKRPPPGKPDRELQLKAYPGLTSRRYEGALDRVFVAAKKVAEMNGIVVTHELGSPEAELADVPVPSSKVVEEPVPDSLDTIPVPVPRPTDEESSQAAPEGDAYIQGVLKSLVAGMRQDIVIRLHEEAETTLVDVRVAARYGRHDLGTGAELANAYLRALDAELLGIAGD